MSPPREYYVDISSESSGSTDFGESSLEHICPVSPPQEYYVDISSESSWSTDFGPRWNIYVR